MPGTRRRLALAHLTVEDATPEELVAAAASAGFSAVGMRICGFAPDADHVGLLGHRTRQRALRRRLDDAGLSVLNVCSFRLADDIEPAAYAPVIDACAALGAPLILLTCFIADKARRAAKLASLAEMAGEAGIAIGLEFFRSSSLRSLDEAEALRRGVDRRNVGHVLDAMHFFRAGHHPSDLNAFDLRHVLGVQICDAPAIAPPEHGLRAEIRARLCPGRGGLALSTLVAALPTDLTLEVEAPTQAFRGLSPAETAKRSMAAAEAFLAAMRKGDA